MIDLLQREKTARALWAVDHPDLPWTDANANQRVDYLWMADGAIAAAPSSPGARAFTSQPDTGGEV